MCRDVVSRRRGRDGITEQVRVRITQALARPASGAGGPADAGMPAVAAALSMSERTLRRRLAAAGTRYQVLLDEVRQALAEEMLETGMLSVEDVAQRLGYAESSSFIHAFKRWRGETPARFRRRPTAGPGSAG
jgi:AraC-like DNA-binding protein